jgi:hypothetical protein
MTDDKPEASQAAPAVGIRLDRCVRRVFRAARWLVVTLAGVVLWLVGLSLLGVPVDLPHWRHISGAALLGMAYWAWWIA